MGYKAIQRYINKRDGRIRMHTLLADATPLPKRHRNIQSFKKSFGNVNYYEYIFEGYFIVLDVKYAFNHFKNNTYMQNREHLNATLFSLLKDPLIVVKSMYNTEDTLTFYKPFKNQSELYHMLMFKAYKKENGKYYFKTIYQADSLDKVDKIIKTIDMRTIYFKYENTEGNGS